MNEVQNKLKEYIDNILKQEDLDISYSQETYGWTFIRIEIIFYSKKLKRGFSCAGTFKIDSSIEKIVDKIVSRDLDIYIKGEYYGYIPSDCWDKISPYLRRISQKVTQKQRYKLERQARKRAKNLEFIIEEEKVGVLGRLKKFLFG